MLTPFGFRQTTRNGLDGLAWRVAEVLGAAFIDHTLIAVAFHKPRD